MTKLEDKLLASVNKSAVTMKPVENMSIDAALAKASGFKVKAGNGSADFTIIEGVGVKINDLIHQAGIHLYSEFAGTDVIIIQGILDDAGSNYNLANPGSWIAQARLAASNQWATLKTWQDELDKGIDLTKKTAVKGSTNTNVGVKKTSAKKIATTKSASAKNTASTNKPEKSQTSTKKETTMKTSKKQKATKRIVAKKTEKAETIVKATNKVATKKTGKLAQSVAKKKVETKENTKKKTTQEKDTIKKISSKQTKKSINKSTAKSTKSTSEKSILKATKNKQSIQQALFQTKRVWPD